MKKLSGLFVVGIGAAQAAVPTEVNSMFTTFQADSLTVIGLATVLVAAVTGAWMLVMAAKKYIRGAK